MSAEQGPRYLTVDGNEEWFYNLAIVEGNSTGIVGQVFGLSDHQVAEHKARIYEARALAMPPDDPIPAEQRRAAAQQLAIERLDYCYKTALEAWERSCGPTTVTREKVCPHQETVRTTTYRLHKAS